MDDWEAVVVWSRAPEVVTWRLMAPSGELRYLKLARLGQERSLAEEQARMVWAAAQLPVPQVLGYGADGEYEWLLTAALVGVNAADDGLRADPRHLVPLVADGLRRFHSVPIGDCPFDSRVDVMVRTAHLRVEHGLVDAQHDLHVDHEGGTAGAALAHLIRRRPEQEDLVVCHGDYCLPNVLISNGQVSGYVDLGNLGVSDHWRDLVVALWSVTYNLGPGWEDLFLDTYGVQRAPDTAAFYRLLQDFIP